MIEHFRRFFQMNRSSTLSIRLNVRLSWVLPVTLLCVSHVFGQAQNTAKAKAQPGLQVTFSSTDKKETKDIVVLPNVSLFVPAAEPPTPFLSGGPFTAVWRGFLSVDIRSDYSFQADISGELKLEINGATVLETSGPGNVSRPSRSVRLNKGTNLLTATFRSPSTGDASLRAYWTPKDGLPAPLPLNGLTHMVSEEELRSAAVHRGRELFAEHRCTRCHGGAAAESGMLELTMDAPSFEGIGSRRGSAWMAKWILDPKTERSTARMPRLFQGPQAKEDAEAAAAYLASLKGELTVSNAQSPEHRELGQKLFESLHCVACHMAPGDSPVDPHRISLKHVRQKFIPGALAAFLKKPEAHFAWTRMPNFKLTDDEASQLAAFLEANSDAPISVQPEAEQALVDRGKRLVQSTGCLNCHGLKLENQFSAKPLAELTPGQWQKGCLAPDRSENSRAPNFAFSAQERDALQAFGATDRSSLGRHVATEFADRQIRNLNCLECHGRFEGFPPLEILGGKLKPEWARAFISGEVRYKPRTWIDARMPSFSRRAEGLAHGMAMLHGYAPRTAAEPALDAEAAKIGQKLVSADGGFACVACHAIAKVGATQVFESAGINLAYSGERLLKPFFFRWLYNPLAIDPTTKMPVYFDEQGKSQLADVYDGDGAKQINALWEYVKLGEKMPPPPGTEAAP